MRAFRLFWTFARVGALNELQYRANLAIQVVESLITLATGLVVLALVFNQVEDLNGWSHAELLAVMGVFTLVGGIIGTFIQPNMERLIHDVRQGTLDYVLTKPDDGQVLVSVREIRIWHLVDVVLGIVILVIAAREIPGTLGATGMAAFLAALLLGTAMVYCFWLILTIAAFWIVRMDEIVELFTGVYQAGRWPVVDLPGLAADRPHVPRSDRVRRHGASPGVHRPTDPGDPRPGRAVRGRAARRHAPALADRPAPLLRRVGVTSSAACAATRPVYVVVTR